MSHDAMRSETNSVAAEVYELSEQESAEVAGGWRWTTTVCGKWAPETPVEAFLYGFYKSQGGGGWQCPN